jgi:hypothetical protein
MQKIDFLTGQWTGNGWIQMGRQKHLFTIRESVVKKVNDAVLVIDGLGTEEETNKVIHQAFATVSYDVKLNKYIMRAFRADGGYVDADAMVDETGRFVWSFQHPQAGTIRFTTALVDNQWIEKGEMSRDGVTWMLFMEMMLSKNE